MNNIEILEDFIEGKIEPDKLENYKGGYKMGFFYTKDLQKAIENLIQENKELKEKVNRQQEQLNIANKKILAQKGQLKVVNNSYIPKSKIKEKIEKLNKEKNEIEQAMNNKLYAYNSSYDLDIYKIKALEELLKGE